MKYASYEVHHYNTRNDGRIEPAGVERLVLSHEEAISLSHTAIVVSLAEGFGGSRTALVFGKHCQFDPRNGWVS